MLDNDSNGADACSTSDDEAVDGEHVNPVFRPCLVKSNQSLHLGLIRNQYSGGCRMELFHDFPEMGELIYQAGDSEPIMAKIVWSGGNIRGIKDIRKLELGDALKFSSLEAQRRPLRIPSHLSVKAWIGRTKVSGRLLDISQNGASITHKAILDLKKGALVHFGIGSMCSLSACVRWQRPGVIGLQFVSPISLRELAGIIAQGTEVDEASAPEEADLEVVGGAAAEGPEMPETGPDLMRARA